MGRRSAQVGIQQDVRHHTGIFAWHIKRTKNAHGKLAKDVWPKAVARHQATV